MVAEAARPLDFNLLVVVLLISVLDLIGDEDGLHAIVTCSMEAVPSGSWLALSDRACDVCRQQVTEVVSRFNRWPRRTPRCASGRDLALLRSRAARLTSKWRSAPRPGQRAGPTGGQRQPLSVVRSRARSAPGPPSLYAWVVSAFVRPVSRHGRWHVFKRVRFAHGCSDSMTGNLNDAGRPPLGVADS